MPWLVHASPTFVFHCLVSKVPRRRVSTFDPRYGTAEDESLKALIAQYGANLGFTACILWLKGDWAEASHTLALPSAVSKHNPCVFCSSCSDDLHAHYRSFAFPRREGSYNAWCTSREIRVVIDTEECYYIISKTYQTCTRPTDGRIGHVDCQDDKFNQEKRRSAPRDVT